MLMGMCSQHRRNLIQGRKAICSKRLTLTKERFGSSPPAPGREPLSPWNILPKRTVFAYLGTLDHAR